MSAIPVFVIGTLCIVGGVSEYVRTRSIPSLVPGAGVAYRAGAPYFYSGDSIYKHIANSLETALGASALLFLHSVPSFAKCPIPAMLTVTLTATGAYYGNAMYKICQ